MHTREQPRSVVRNFLLRMEQFMRRHGLVRPGMHVLLGVSGGMDSAAMLDAFCGLQKKWDLRLSIAHVNYGLRGTASDGDERFVRRLASTYGIPVHVERAETKQFARARRQSVQLAARTIRYQFFDDIAKLTGADRIAVAHNANDNAETMLFNFFRGTGIDGLRGIPLSSQPGVDRTSDRPDGACTVIRPLQFAERSEIAAYMKARKLRHREDASNDTSDYSRNFIRRNVIPSLEKRINPSLVRTLNNGSAIFAECADMADMLVARAERECIRKERAGYALSVKHLGDLHVFIQHMLVKRCMELLGIEPNFVHIDEIIRLLGKESGTVIDCGSGVAASRTSSAIVIGRTVPDTTYVLHVDAGEEAVTSEFTFGVRDASMPDTLKAGVRTSVRRSCIEYVDAASITFPLTVRPWQPGDRFIPLGMKTMKKLSDFFTDQKIPRSAKSRIPVVLSGNDIVWIAGMRLDERCKVTSRTHTVYQLSIQFHI